MKLLKYENAKLKKQLIFSLPASQEICGQSCPRCYAMKFQRLYPTVLPYRIRMHAASLTSDFVTKVVHEIRSFKKPLEAVRIHESGEFYSQEYIDKWSSVASALPMIKFYAFTKRLANFDFTPLTALPNVTIIDSLQNNRLNYGKLADLPTTGVICPATTAAKARCGIDCMYCWQKQAEQTGVQFIIH